MTIQIFLKTPLYKGSYGADRSVQLTEAVVEIQGSSAHRDGGLEVQVPGLFDSRGRAVTAPFQTLFIPLGKVDYYVVMEA